MARLVALFEALREERVERRRLRRRLRATYFTTPMPDTEFISNYRLTKELFEELCQDIVPLLPAKRVGHAIDPVSKILVALSFYARGSYQGAVGQNTDTPMSQQSVSKCLRQVTVALNTPNILKKYIKFPQTRHGRNVIKRQFFEKCGIPGIIGCIDCTHVAIIRPLQNEERFFNRKGYHSLNIQMIVDSDLKILNLDASYGGASHDSFIWQHHEIKTRLEELHRQGEIVILLGDSGYPLRAYMITPFENPIEESPAGRFNKAHKCMRSVVERTFGVLKGRWRCLLAARELHYDPSMAGKIAVACSVLHNMCNNLNLEVPEFNDDEIQAETVRQPPVGAIPQAATAALNEGRRARDQLVLCLGENRR